MVTRRALVGCGVLSMAWFGCAHAPPPEATAPVEPGSERGAELADATGADDRAAADTVPDAVTEPAPLAPSMNFEGLVAVDPAPLPAFTAVLDGCRDPDDGECPITRTAGFDTRHQHWVVFDVDPGEYTPGDAWLGTVGAGDPRTVFEGRVERRRLAALRRGLGTFRAVAPGRNLVTHASSEAYSITSYNALVALGGELDGWAMWIEASEPLAGYGLHLARRDATEDRVLATSPDDPHCHDGELQDEADEADDAPAVGESTPPTDADPADARSCTPIGIDAVLLSPDRSTILVLGTRAMNGHGGAPAMHWVVPTPAGLVPEQDGAAP